MELYASKPSAWNSRAANPSTEASTDEERSMIYDTRVCVCVLYVFQRTRVICRRNKRNAPRGTRFRSPYVNQPSLSWNFRS